MRDEIICALCGRPNLPEAERCWYCQHPLAETQPAPDESAPGAAEGTGQESALPLEEEQIQGDGISDNDIPEWLKRVRELKKADQPEEEPEDQWRQPILFGSASQSAAPKAQKKPANRLPAKPAPTRSDKDSTIDTQQSLAPVENEEFKQDLPGTDGNEADEETPGSNDQLPQGFKPLRTKEE